MIIKTEDFKLGAFIPNRDDAPNSDIIGNEPVVQGFIDTEVEEILVELLGFGLFSELEDQLDDDGQLLDSADQKWKDLVNGKDNYRGLKKLLVSYVFYKYILNDRSYYSTMGTHQPTSDKAIRVEPSSKAIAEYQKFFKQAIGNYYSGPKVVTNSMGIPGLIWGSYGSNFASLYDFLAENVNVYTNWVANWDIEDHNVYDI